MVYFSGLGSIVESIYLGEDLGENRLECNIYVNPENVTYLTHKVVIVNSLHYSLSAINELLKNRNKVVLRVALEGRNGAEIYNPYILRPEWGVMWNGMTIEEEVGENWEDEIMEDCTYDFKNRTLYFPKITSTTSDLKDSQGSLTPLGWLLHQVGQGVDSNSIFTDLDLFKTKKMQI